MDYHTNEAQNKILTRVGPGTPMGNLLRRYWWPIGFSKQLQDKPTMVRLLGEDLVLFRDGQGRLGLLAEKCPHRRASLCLGMVGKEGIRCRYHGWLMDTKGTLLHAPGEEKASDLTRRVKQPAYLAQEVGDVIFGYLGPQPAPLLPRFHILVAEGERNATVQSFNDCNWLQCVENGIDPFHVSFLHSDVWTPMSAEPEQVRFEHTELGCIYKAIRPGRKAGEYNYRDHPVVAPGIIVGGDTNVSYGGEGQGGGLPAASMRWSVPIDDTHTMNVRVYFRPKGQPRSKIEMRQNPGVGIKIEPYKELRQGQAVLGYEMPAEVPEEDATMLDSLGPISDRDNENLSTIDGGIVLLRKMLLEDIEKMKAGQDPRAVFRDPAKNQLLIIGASYRWITREERDAVLKLEFEEA